MSNRSASPSGSRSRTTRAAAAVMEPAVGLPGFSSLQDSPQEPLGAAGTGLGAAETSLGRESSPSAPSSGSDGTPWADGPAAVESEGPWSDPESADDVDGKPRRTGSSRTSSPAEVRANLAAFEGMVEQGVEMGGEALHALRVRDELERQVGLYLTDEQDQRGIAKPAARLMSRHSDGDLGNPDLNDGLGILMALANYVIKQVAKMRMVAQAKAEIASSGQFDSAGDGQAA